LIAEHSLQVDGNFGYAAGVCEMLLQSHMGEIHVLPALPAVWKTGSAEGLKARGGFIVDIKWEDHALSSLVLKSKRSGSCVVRYKGHRKQIEVEPDSSVRVTFDQ
jgi:alpha-L-fucosidase 2